MEDTTKNVSIVDERGREFPTYTPSKEEENILSSVFYKFRQSANQRNQNFEYFDGITIIDYIEDSVKRFVTNFDEREGIEDWQARIHDPFTRNKVLAILGKIVQVLPIAQVTGRGDEDLLKGTILSNLYEYSEELDDYEELMINVLIECIVKGTAIGYEGLERKVKKVKNITGIDDKITISEKKQTTNKLFGSIVPLEDFYPSSVSIRRVKDMPHCFWRSLVPYESFCQDYQDYERTKFVQPKTPNSETDADFPFYKNFISLDVPTGMVEIIRYYNKDVDEYVIIANGIWLNPVMIGGKGEISPLPWNHKELPFWDIKYDIFGPDFFYGKSLPDRLKAMQDVLNVLTNMLLDQSFLTIFPPMLTNGFDDIEDDYLRPGRRTPIDTQGVPIQQAFMKLDLGTPSGWHQYILEYTRKIMEQSSLDQVSSGNAGVGGRTTAQEIRLAADGVSSMLGLFARMVNYGIKRKAQLRAANILQFWTRKDSPVIEGILGDGGNGQFKDAFNIFRIENAALTSGKRGAKIIEMYADKSKMPTLAQNKARVAVSEAASGKKIEIISMDPEYIRNFMYDIKLVPNPKSASTKDMDKALQLEKVRVYLSFFSEMIDKRELAAQTAEKMGDDPSKILNDETLHPQQQQNPEAENPMSQQPQENTSNNAVRGAMGGEQNSMQMRDLSNTITGQ